MSTSRAAKRGHGFRTLATLPPLVRVGARAERPRPACRNVQSPVEQGT